MSCHATRTYYNEYPGTLFNRVPGYPGTPGPEAIALCEFAVLLVRVTDIRKPDNTRELPG